MVSDLTPGTQTLVVAVLNQIQQKKDALTQRQAAEVAKNNDLKKQMLDLNKQKNESDVKISREVYLPCSACVGRSDYTC